MKQARNKIMTKAPVTSQQQGKAIEWQSIDAGYEARVKAAVSAYFKRRGQHRRHTTPHKARTPTGRMDTVGLDDNRQAVSTSAGLVEGGQAVAPEASTPVERVQGGLQKGDNPPTESGCVIHNTRHIISTPRSEPAHPCIEDHL